MLIKIDISDSLINVHYVYVRSRPHCSVEVCQLVVGMVWDNTNYFIIKMKHNNQQQQEVSTSDNVGVNGMLIVCLHCHHFLITWTSTMAGRGSCNDSHPVSCTSCNTSGDLTKSNLDHKKICFSISKIFHFSRTCLLTRTLISEHIIFAHCVYSQPVEFYPEITLILHIILPKEE